MRRSLPWILAALALAGCPTREMFLEEPIAPYQAHRIARLRVPDFQAPPAGWTIAGRARDALVSALARGTVTVVGEGDPADATLEGGVVRYEEPAMLGTPRRANTTNAFGQPSYRWEADARYEARLTIAVRLVTPDGKSVWSAEGRGEASENRVVALPWMSSDAFGPVNAVPPPADEGLVSRLREDVLADALAPLVAALTRHYAYRVVD